MLSKSFKSGKCKTSLKLAVSRIKLLKNRREIQVKKLRQEVAQLLATGHEPTARIRIENVIREEKTLAAYDLIEIYCELIVARLPIIESQKSCPIDLKEAISSVIFASPRCADLPELADVQKQFATKYGKEFSRSALELRPDCGVNRLIIEKLSAKAPDTDMKLKILTAIAKEHEVNWDSKAFEEELHKPEDLLDGANKLPMEKSTPNFSLDDSQIEPASNVLKANFASKQTSKNLRTATPLASSFTLNESSESDRKFGPSEVKGLYQDEESFSSKKSAWRVEFKDAASAAQVAAESAERANMAARAAAEFASQENISRQNSNELNRSSVQNSRNERENRSASSKLKESVTIERDEVKGFPEMKDEEVNKLPRDELREEIPHLNSASHADLVGNGKKLDGYPESFNQMEPENKNTRDDPEFTDKSADSRYDRSASASFTSSHEDGIIWAPFIDKHEAGIHSNLDYNEMNSRDSVFSYDNNEQHASGDYPAAVFDDYSPEPTDYKENLLDSFDRIHNHEPFAASSSTINPNIFSTSVTMEKAPSSKFASNATIEKAPSSKFDDKVFVTYDDSDDLMSESEDDTTGSQQKETVHKSSSLNKNSGLNEDSHLSEQLQPIGSSKTQLELEIEENKHHQVSSSKTPDEKPVKEDFSLNFKRLTGGLKNRGYSHPPFTASSISTNQPVLNQEKSRKYRGDDPNLSKQVPFDEEETPIISKVVNQKVHLEDKDSQTGIERRANANAGKTVRLSRRTKDFTSKDRANLPKSTAYSDMPDSTQNQPPGEGSAIESPSQTVDEAKILTGMPHLKPSETMNISDGNSTKSKPSDSGGGPKLQANSQKSTHVHPKLPDYETLAAHFHSLRSNRR